MSPPRVVSRVRHTALESQPADPVAEGRLTDRARLAVVLQGAALLSHLDAAGCCLASAWEDLEIDSQGVLRGARVAMQSDRRSARSRIVGLMALLFGAAPRISGKGQANRLADRLLQRWQRTVRDLPASRMVTDLLDAATFLWQPAFSIVRQSLVAELWSQDSMRCLVAGRGCFEARLLARARDYQQLTKVLMSEEAAAVWLDSRRSAAAPGIAGAAAAGSPSAEISRWPRRAQTNRDAAAAWLRRSGLRLGQGHFESAARAASHAQRLAEGNDSELVDSALLAWIEIRLRQGSILDVEPWLTLSDSLLEAGGNESRNHLAELECRWHLLRGKPQEAHHGLQALSRRTVGNGDRRHGVRRALAARALGWLGRGAEAREQLDGMSVTELACLEAEERPAVWALAGDWARAREAATNDAIGGLWKLGLAGDPIPEERWDALASLEAYRSARMVFDFQLLLPGRVPDAWLDRAAERLRLVGAHSFAERMDRGRNGSWRALERYLSDTSTSNHRLGELFEVAGYFDVRLEWRHRHIGEVLVSGMGGAEALTAEKSDGRLQLRAGHVDPTLRALFALAARDYRPPPNPQPRRRRRAAGILGASPALERALDRLERLADTDLTVLIQGETGTGKELAARQVHRLSSRSSQRMVAVNCAALSESLLLSELFGHVRGAFTGADRDRAGIFETASGGTVLLDEIGDLPLAAQGKLLRVLQEGEVRRVGESLPREVDVRVLAATHRDLESMVDEGAFRRDLYYRLKVSQVTLPPLRHRQGDVLMLAEHFVSRSGHRLTGQARRRLTTYSWPGNVRELRNVLQVAVALSDEETVDLEDLDLPKATREKALGYHAQVEELRCRLVREALGDCDGHRARAARRLGVSRQALSYLVKRFGLEEC